MDSTHSFTIVEDDGDSETFEFTPEYRDSETVWLVVDGGGHVEIARAALQRLLDGFPDDEDEFASGDSVLEGIGGE